MPEANRVIFDTNLLVRYLTDDEPHKADAVENLINLAEKGELRIILPSIVMAELVWVLESYYELNRKKIARLLEGVIRTPGIEVEERALLLNALSQYQRTSIDFIDSWILSFASDKGIRTIYTFDKKHFHSAKNLEVKNPLK